MDDELTDEYRIQLSHDGSGKRSVQLFTADGTLFYDLNLPPAIVTTMRRKMSI